MLSLQRGYAVLASGFLPYGFLIIGSLQTELRPERQAVLGSVCNQEHHSDRSTQSAFVK